MKYLVLFVNTLGRLSFRDNELKSLLEMRGVTGAEMSWVREGVEGDEVVVYGCVYIYTYRMCSLTHTLAR